MKKRLVGLIAAAVALLAAETLTAGEGGQGLKYQFKSGCLSRNRCR